MLGAQLYSVREAMAGEGADAVLGRLAEIGYGFVEPTFASLGGDPAGFRRTLDRHGLAAPSMHAPVLGARREEVARAAEVIGVETVVVALIPAEEFADVERSARRLTEAAEWLARRGLKLAYHNHYWERDGLEVLAGLTPAQVVLELDAYWAAVGGADVPALLARLGDRVRLLHVKDGPSTVDGPMTAVGAGVLPMDAILAAAPAGALRIVELDRCESDVFAALAESHSYLSGRRQ